MINAIQVKKLLKEKHGINPNYLRVKTDHNSIRLHSTHPSVDLNLVENTLKQFESIHRCEATGEILSGGNKFVFCRIGINDSDLPNELVQFGYQYLKNLMGKHNYSAESFFLKDALKREFSGQFNERFLEYIAQYCVNNKPRG